MLREAIPRFPATGPAWASTVAAGGLPYFRRFVPGQAPVRCRATCVRRRRHPRRAPRGRVPFPSDPGALVLDRNDLAVHLRSDRSTISRLRGNCLRGDLASCSITSSRKRLRRRRLRRRPGPPQAAGLAAGIPAASPDPRPARSCSSASPPLGSEVRLGPGCDRGFLEMLPGFTDQWPVMATSRNGTNDASLAHVRGPRGLVPTATTTTSESTTAFRPGLRCPAGNAHRARRDRTNAYEPDLLVERRLPRARA